MALPAKISIGELAQRTGVAPSALRFYEERGLITAERTDGNQRRFARSTIRRVSVIRAAQTVGVSLAEIGEALGDLPSGREPNEDDWRRLSESWKEHLDNRIDRLERLRDRLTGCIGCGCLSLDTCQLVNPDDEAATFGPGPRYL